MTKPAPYYSVRLIAKRAKTTTAAVTQMLIRFCYPKNDPEANLRDTPIYSQLILDYLREPHKWMSSSQSSKSSLTA
jgi:hypothetical protein